MATGFNLATQINSLPRVSKRTMQSETPFFVLITRIFLQRDLADRIYLWLHGFRVFSSPAKDSFQLSLTVLVRYRSRVIFRIGSYCLPHSDWISDQPYSGYPASAFSRSPTGLSPSMACHSRQLRIGELGRTQVQTPHSLTVSCKGSVCPVPLSVALTQGIANPLFR